MIRTLSDKLIDNIESVILGKREEIKLVLIALLCEGHILIEDVPGVGKTMLTKAIAKSLGCSFARIQFTPDLLPSDIMGVNIFNQKNMEFEFRRGPIHHQIVLADEINRATPKTQSALLEAMEERQLTIEGITYPLPRPFIVLATQNPLEYEGTFPLPECQLDRFFLRIRLGYPSFEAENQILQSQREHHPIEDLQQVISAQELSAAQKEVKEIFVSDKVREYLVRIVQATRKAKNLYLGASPRGSLALYKASQALAGIEGRDYVLPDDVKRMIIPTLAHRILGLNDNRDMDTLEQNLQAILSEQPIPVLEEIRG